MTEIAGEASVVGLHARAGVAKAALENDTREPVWRAESSGDTRHAGSTNTASGRGATPAVAVSSESTGPGTCANSAPAEVTNPAGASFARPRAVRPGNWTEEEHELIRQCIRAGMTSRQVQEQHFPNRTPESLKRKMGVIRAEIGMPAETNFNRSKHYRAAPKTLALEPLQYDISECPRVTFAEAVEWMRKVKRHWSPTGNHREDWRFINAHRLFGAVPVPPFLPRGDAI